MIIVTGSGGLIGSEAVAKFSDLGMQVHGVDNNLRQYFFGESSSTQWRVQELEKTIPNYTHHDIDLRNYEAVEALVKSLASELKYVVHAAAQPSHDWAAKEPLTDFSVNAIATHYLLEAVRKHAPHAAFVFLSTNKVYGDTPNSLPLVETDTRWELDPSHPFADKGIDETMSIDQSTHSVFGASKVAADVMVQEYGRYFGMNTAVFRGGCLTGSGHSGAELHGFLAYLMQCIATDKPYRVFGYKGKQVRDNIHSSDLVAAIWEYFKAPAPAKVYNMGGSRFSNCSMLEAIAMGEKICGRSLNWTYDEENRIGDHIWWISDISRFQQDYPDFKLQFDIQAILEEMFENGHQRWRKSAP
nr:NAD-dependent epimerase/dehydratase family protein [uncultured Cohaesibacter sp.]